MNYNNVTQIEQKANLSYEGRDVLGVNASTWTASTGFLFSSLTRVNRGQLELTTGTTAPLGVQQSNGWEGSIAVTSTPAVTSTGSSGNGMIDPSITVQTNGWNSALAFATYLGSGSTGSLSTATFTSTNLSTAGTSERGQRGRDGPGLQCQCLGPGDHRRHQRRDRHAGQRRSDLEQLQHIQRELHRALHQPRQRRVDRHGRRRRPDLAPAAITASGLTMGGGGNLTLDGNNTGLTGTIVVNGGTLTVGAGGVSPTNAMVGSVTQIVLNGGVNNTQGSSNFTTPIAIGRGGGYQAWWACAYYSPLVDPANSSYGTGVFVSNGYLSMEVRSTWTGGLVVNNGGWRCDGPGNCGMGPVTVMPGNAIVTYGSGWTKFSGGRCWPETIRTIPASSSPGKARPARTTRSSPSVRSRAAGNISLGQYGYNGFGGSLVVGTDNTNADYYGSIFPIYGGGSNAVTKTGTGTVTCGRYSWRSATTVSGGTLVINGTLSSGNYAAPAVTVNSSATLGGQGPSTSP